MASEPIPISFNLSVHPGLTTEKFSVPTICGKNLFDSLKTFQESNDKFNFQTKDDPNIGRYVTNVMGKGNQTNKIWEILLRQTKGGEHIPINLDYKVNSGETVCLRFTPV